MINNNNNNNSWYSGNQTLIKVAKSLRQADFGKINDTWAFQWITFVCKCASNEIYCEDDSTEFPQNYRKKMFSIKNNWMERNYRNPFFGSNAYHKSLHYPADPVLGSSFTRNEQANPLSINFLSLFSIDRSNHLWKSGTEWETRALCINVMSLTRSDSCHWGMSKCTETAGLPKKQQQKKQKTFKKPPKSEKKTLNPPRKTRKILKTKPQKKHSKAPKKQ